MEKHTDLKGKNISYDRLYTSITLANWLLERNITTVGRLKGNRKGVPEEVKKIRGREQNSYEFFWDGTGKLTLHSYVVNTKSSGRKNVLMLSTPQPILGTAKGDVRLKPAIYKVYDFTKGGTDVIDQRINLYTCKAKSRR